VDVSLYILLFVGLHGEPRRTLLANFLVNNVLQPRVFSVGLFLQLVDVVQVAPLVMLAKVHREDFVEFLLVAVLFLNFVARLAADIAVVLFVLLHPLSLITQLSKRICHQTAHHVTKQ
jgi:hypothetical protein